MTSISKRAAEKSAHAEIERKLTKKKYPCMFPGCKESAISSHSQQKNGSLRAIAESGKIIRLDDSLLRSYNHIEDKLDLSMCLKGIGESSTFPGFCIEHERIFEIFEQNPLKQGCRQQVAALHYRTVAYEYARKRRELERWTSLQEKILETRGLREWNSIFQTLQGIEGQMENTLKPSLKTLGDHFRSQKPLNLKHVWLRTLRNIGASCSACVNMHLDDYISYVRQHPKKPLPFFSLNVIPSAGATDVIFSWDAEFNDQSGWICQSTTNAEVLNQLLNRLLFCDTEDSCFNPTLWQKIPNKEYVISNMHHVAVRGPLKSWHIPSFITTETTWTQSTCNT